jgi:hypothetical protein
MTRPVDEDASGAGAIFGLLMEEKERLRRTGREEGDGSEAEERDRESESGVSIRDDALRRFTAPTRFRNATCVEIKLSRRVSATAESWPPRHRCDVSTTAVDFHTECDRLRVLAGLGVPQRRAAPPVDGVDVRTPRHQILDGRQVPFGGSKVQGSSVVVVCVWTSTNESGLRDPSQPSRRRVDGVRS